MWWSDPLKALDGPPRGDFEQIIQDRLKPVFEAARKRAFAALSKGDEFDEEEERAALIALFLPVLTNAVIFAVNDLEGQFTLGFEIDDVQAQAREWAKQKAEVLADQLLTTTRGLLDGITPEETESALERAFGAARRENIGISETTDALSSGALLFQRLAAALGIIVDLIWYTRKDERVCFPKGTKVVTRQGEKAIELVTVGDVVKTQGGWDAVSAVHKTEYHGEFVSFWASGNLVTCTSEHPVFVLEKGWLEANKLNVGDRVQLSDDKIAHVARVVNFSFSNPDDLPSKFGEIFGFPAVLFRVLMPILTVNLKRDLVRGNKKVNAVASSLTLLDKVNIKLGNSSSYLSLEQRFSGIFSVARKRAKLPIGIAWNASEFFATSLAFDNPGRPSAFLRAIARRPSFFPAAKFLPATLASKRFEVDGSAFPATDCISICDAGVDLELPRANRANLQSLFGGHVGLPTCGRAETLPASNSASLEISLLSALRTNDSRSRARGSVIAFCGAISRLSSNPCRSLKRFFAMLANIREHGVLLLTSLRLLYHGLCGNASVYNLSVENDPTFYANNVLVHNCQICRPLHNKGKAVWSVQFPNGPKAHNRCRCGLRAERRFRMWGNA